jgi:hypothetical protein
VAEITTTKENHTMPTPNYLLAEATSSREAAIMAPASEQTR